MSMEQLDLQLPQEILVKIFSLLSFNDRLKARQTCHLWNDVSQQPQFYRKRHFCLMGLEDEENWRVQKYMTNFSKHLRHLAISVFPEPGELGSAETERVFYAIEDIFRILHREMVQLRSFSFRGLAFLTNYFCNNTYPISRRAAEILTSLGSLFERQNCLSAVELTECDIADTDSEKVQLLHSLFSPRTAARITSITIHSFFDKEFTADPGFLEMMGRFKSLSAIGLTYHYVSNNVLTELTNASPDLKCIMLYVDLFHGKSKCPSSVPDWETAVKKNPDLRLWVKFIYDLDFEVPYFCSEFLVPVRNVPLVGVSLEMRFFTYTDSDIYDCTEDEIKAINGIISCINDRGFKSFVLSLPSRPGRPWNRPQTLVDLVQACPAITHLCLQVTMSLDTLIQIRNCIRHSPTRGRKEQGGGHFATPTLQLHIRGCDPALEKSDLEKLFEPFCSIRFCHGCEPQLSNPDSI